MGPQHGIGALEDIQMIALLTGLFSLLLAIAAFGFWVWMFIECLTKEPSEGNDKLIWAAVIFFLNGLWALSYYFIRRPTRIEQFGE